MSPDLSAEREILDYATYGTAVRELSLIHI